MDSNENENCSQLCQMVKMEDMNFFEYKTFLGDKCHLESKCPNIRGNGSSSTFDDCVAKRPEKVERRQVKSRVNGTAQELPDRDNKFPSFFYGIVLKMGTSITSKISGTLNEQEFSIQDLWTYRNQFGELLEELEKDKNDMCKEWINTTMKAFDSYLSRNSSKDFSVSVGELAAFFGNLTRTLVLPKTCNSTMKKLLLKNIAIGIYETSNHLMDGLILDTGDKITAANRTRRQETTSEDSANGEAKVIHITLSHSPLQINNSNVTMHLASDIKTIEVIEEHSVGYSAELLFQTKYVQVASNPGSEYTHCLYWDPNGTNWSDVGLETISIDYDVVKCRSNHLSTFAVFISQTKFGEKHELALRTISLIGCILSLTAVIITVLVFLILLREAPLLRTTRYVAHFNLILSLGLMQLCFLFTLILEDHKVGCKAVAIALHYFSLTSFSWMAVEGVILYVKVIMVFHQQRLITKYILYAAWGVPFVFVCPAATIRHESYGNNKICWLTFQDNFVIWAFILPLGFIVLFDVVVMVLVTTKTVQLKRETTRKRAITVVRSFGILAPLLGATWIFGILAFSTNNIALHYAFAITNSVQGFVIFLIYGIGNEELRGEMCRKLLDKRSFLY